jgi:hypothetical protein
MLANIDNNIWGLLAVPVGVLLGFGPAIVAWLLRSYRRTNRPSPRHPPEPEEQEEAPGV